MSDKVLEVKNITKRYKNLTVLDNLSFDIFEGEIFGFLGPNGAGKTTLMRLICGMSKPTSGEIFVCGYSVQKEFEKAIMYVGAMIENCQVYPYMTGYQNLTYYAGLYKGIDQSSIDDVVEIVGMTSRIHDKVKTYSYCMRKRIALAQDLLHHPKLLVLDEPTNGLDANGVIELRKTLKLLAAKTNMSILVSSHILAEMEQVCDTIAVFNHGKLLELRTIDSIQKMTQAERRVSIKVDYPNYACKIVLSSFNIEPEIAGSCILVPYDIELVPKIINALKSKGIKLYEAKTINKNLEDIYLEILRNKNRNKKI